MVIALVAFVAGTTQPEVSRRYVSRLFDRVERRLGADPLVATATWPFPRGGQYQIGMPRNSLSPAQVVPLEDVPPEQRMLAAGGGAWGIGDLNVYLSTRDDKIAQIIQLDVLVFRHEDAGAAWVYEPSQLPRTGPSDDERYFSIDLDVPQRRLVDRGVVRGGIPNALAVSESLGPTFTVSATDPARILVTVAACRGLYEWGLRITYVVAGKRLHFDVGTARQPFRSIGGDTNRVFTTRPGLSGAAPGSAPRLVPVGRSQRCPVTR